MKKINLIIVMIILFSGCKSDEKNKQKLLDIVEENKSSQTNFNGYFDENNKEKVRLGEGKYWLELTIDDVLFKPTKKTKTIKKDKYSKGYEVQTYEVDILVTIKNINNQYLEFDNEVFRRLRIHNEIGDYHALDYDVLWSDTKEFSIDKNESIQFKLSFRGNVNETMNPLYLYYFYTKSKDGINYKTAFKIDFENRKIIDKNFYEITDGWEKKHFDKLNE